MTTRAIPTSANGCASSVASAVLGVEALVTVVVVVEAVGVVVLVVVVVEAAGVVDVADLLDVVEFSVVGFGVCVCGVCSAASATTKVPVADAPSLNWNAMVCVPVASVCR